MNELSLEERLPLSQWKRFGLDVRRRVDPIAIHGIATIVAILVMSLTELILNITMGHEAKFYDAIPVRYVIQTIDMVMFARFTINVWREFR